MHIFIFLSILSQIGGLTVVPYAPGDSTPFVIKIEIDRLVPNTVYDCGIWLYGKPSSISQVWTEDGWKGGYRYVYFTSDSTGRWCSYKKMRVVKEPDPYYDYYIKCTIRDTMGDKLIEHKYRHSEGFHIIDIDEFGFIKGLIYRDSSFCTPLENVILFARDADGNVIGGYLSENNYIEEGYNNTPGYFRLGLPSTTVTSILIEDSTGNPLGQITGEWEVTMFSTIDLGMVFPSNIVIPPGGMRLSPSSVFPGEDVQITSTIQNTGQYTIYSIPVTFSIRERRNETSIYSTVIILDSILGLTSIDVNIIWSPEVEGNYIIKVEAALAEGFARLRVGDPQCEIVINEIMCYPDISEDWIELYNVTDTTIDIKNYKIESSDEIEFISRESCLIEEREFFIICDSKEDYFRTVYGYIPPGISIISLSDKFPELRGTSGDTTRIVDADMFIIDEVRYDKDWIPDKGISLERINSDITSNIASNWGRCVEKKYSATPGRENSIYSSYTPGNLEFACTDVFCPTSEEKMCFIEYHLPFKQAHVRLYVYDRIGRLVKKILDGDPTGSASYSLDEDGNIIWTHIWDGMADNGVTLPMGAYIVYLEAQNGETEEVVMGKRTTTLIKDMR